MSKSSILFFLDREALRSGGSDDSLSQPSYPVSSTNFQRLPVDFFPTLKQCVFVSLTFFSKQNLQSFTGVPEGGNVLLSPPQPPVQAQSVGSPIPKVGWIHSVPLRPYFFNTSPLYHVLFAPLPAHRRNICLILGQKKEILLFKYL